MPLFSIITVTFNAQKCIEACIESVLKQDGDYEYIIIDGNSTDQTKVLIDSYRSKLAAVISEDDEGIYDAMNKAIDLSKGDYLFFLGADDLLYSSQTLSDIGDYLKNDDLDFISGLVKYTSGKVFQSHFNFKTLLNNTLHHQGTFYHRRLFNQFRFDTSLKLIADYELNLKLYKVRNSLDFKFVNQIITLCADGGQSRSNLDRARLETNIVRRKVLGSNSLLYQMIYQLKFFISTKLLPK